MEELQRKKIIIQYLDKWMCLREDGHSIGAYLKKQNILSAGIYGYSVLGRHLLRELEDAGVEVKWVMDQRDVSNQISCMYLQPDSSGAPKNVDVVIITAVTDVKEIEKKFLNMGFRIVISMEELFEEIGRYRKL